MEVLAGRRQIGATDRGAHVKTLEEALVGAGFGLPGGAQPDTVFTKGTTGTILRFQKDRALPQTGVIDAATLTALDRAVVAKKGGKGGPAKVDTVKLMNDMLTEARTPGSDGGSRITKPELDRALSALSWDDGAISPSEYQAAKAALEAEAFQRVATADAKARALEFLREHAARAGKAPEAGLQVKKLDQAAREAALGKGVFASESQAAHVTLATAPGGTEGLADLVKRALGRQGAQDLAVDPFQSIDQGGLLRLLGRKVGGRVPAGDETQRAAAHLAQHASGGGRIHAADWVEKSAREETQGTFFVASKSGGTDLLVVDLLRAGG